MAEHIVPALAHFHGAPGLADVAEKSWQIWPAESAVIPAAIFDEAELARVTGVDADSSREIEWRRIRGGPLEYRPTVAYQLRDAVVSRGHVILRQLVRPVTREPRPAWARYAAIENAPAVLTATFNTSRYFGHWVMDELTRVLAAPEIGQPVAPPREFSGHQRDYLRLLQLEQKERTDVLFRQLLIIDDRTQNIRRRRHYQVLRERAMHDRRPAPYKGVMLLRKQTVARILVNEAALAAHLTGQGFAVMCPTEHSVDEILNVCTNANIVVGVEGSQLVHALLVMRPGGTLVTLQPPNRFNNILKTYCDGLGLRYAFTVGHPHEHGFRVGSDQLMRLLDRVRCG